MENRMILVVFMLLIEHNNRVLPLLLKGGGVQHARSKNKEVHEPIPKHGHSPHMSTGLPLYL